MPDPWVRINALDLALETQFKQVDAQRTTAPQT
jgi:hypothetical protein